MAEREVARLGSRMLAIGRDNQWLVEEDLLSLPKRHPVTVPVLLEVAVIPIKAGTACQGVICRHAESIWQTYTRRKTLRAPNGWRVSGERRSEA